VKQILLVEDDPMIARSLQIALSMEGFGVTIAATIKQARELFVAHAADLVLLDVGLPDGEGFAFCEWVKTSAPELPVIMLTAYIDESSAVRGLSIGANDYIRKPFGNKELIVRIRKWLSPFHLKEKVCFGPLELNATARTSTLFGKKLMLSKKEFDILFLFAQRPNKPFSREGIIAQVGQSDELSDRTIDSHVSHLRSKLREASQDQIRITSVYGVGYMLEQN
jgi:DNA-binding response OmpR family regulator